MLASSDLSRYGAYEGLDPIFICIEELVLQVYPPQISMVLGTIHMHIVFQGHQGLHIHEKVEHKQPPIGRTV